MEERTPSLFQTWSSCFGGNWFCSALDCRREHRGKEFGFLIAERVGTLGAFRLALKHAVGERWGAAQNSASPLCFP